MSKTPHCRMKRRSHAASLLPMDERRLLSLCWSGHEGRSYWRNTGMHLDGAAPLTIYFP